MKENSVLSGQPTDVSFCMVELKFDGSKIKICEFGEGCCSLFSSHEFLFGEDWSIWSALWDSLGRLNLPMWLVNGGRYVKSLDKFIGMGGRVFNSMNDIENDPGFKTAQEKFCNKKGIGNCTGIVIGIVKSCSVGLTQGCVCASYIKKKYPGIIVCGGASSKFFKSKIKTNLLFKDQELDEYKPRHKIYPRTYTSQLAQEVFKDLGCDIFVIKPIRGANGKGVIIVEKENLDETLKLILTDERLPIQYRNDHSYTYWKSGKKNIQKEEAGSFIIEEFVPSKTIEVDGKLYDPTMRVAFTILHDSGLIKIDFLGAYWNLAVKSLEEKGTLNEKHKTDATSVEKIHGRPFCAEVSLEDFEVVREQLIGLLPGLYVNILQSI
jgi:hypothetical protein